MCLNLFAYIRRIQITNMLTHTHHPIKCTALSQSAGAWQLSLATSSTEQLVPALLDAARWKDNNARETGLQLLEEAWKEAKGRAMDAGRNQSQYGRPTNLDITFQ